MGFKSNHEAENFAGTSALVIQGREPVGRASAYAK